MSLNKTMISENTSTTQAMIEPRNVSRIIALDFSTMLKKKPIVKIGFTIIGNDQMV
jgi:hypothetical protein